MQSSGPESHASIKEIKVHYFKERSPSDSSISVIPSFTNNNRTQQYASVGDFDKGPDSHSKNRLESVQRYSKAPLQLLKTREIARYQGYEVYIKTSLVELFIYLCFLLILSLSVIERPSPDIDMFTSSMVEKFTQRTFSQDDQLETLIYNDINTINHVWEYLSLLVIIFSENSFLNSSNHTKTEKRENKTLFHDNDLIGLPRLKSVRVQNDSCKVVKEMENENKVCYNHFSAEQEDTEAFGLKVSTAWSYTPAEETRLPTVEGTVSIYGGGGFYQDCSKSADQFNVILKTLREGKWIDRATRAVTVDFTVYNVNLDLFSFIKLLFEIPPTGGVIPSFIIQTMKISDDTDESKMYSAYVVLFYMFIVLFTVQELLELAYLKWEYFKSMCNFLDVLILLMCYSVIVNRTLLHIVSLKELEEIVSNDNKFANFNHLIELHTLYNITLSSLTFCCWVKLLKYFSIYHSVFKLEAALKLAIKDIVWFSIIFAFVLFIFALMAHVLFGSRVECYHSMSSSMLTILQAGLGEFDYPVLQRVSPFLGPTFFFFFIFFVCLIFVAIYIAILVYAYEEVRYRMKDIYLQMSVRDVIENSFVNFIRRFSHRYATRMMNSFNSRKIQKEFQDERCLLKAYGYTEMEISTFLKKYELSVARVMTSEDLLHIQRNVTTHGPSRLRLVQDMVRQNTAEKLSILENAVKNANYQANLILYTLDRITAKMSSPQ